MQDTTARRRTRAASPAPASAVWHDAIPALSALIIASPHPAAGASHVVLETVDDEILAGDEARFGGRQKDDQLRHVVGLAEPAQGDAAARDLRPTAARDGIAELGLDEARADGVDQEGRPELLSEGTC